jgi:hypothetical protein
LTMEFDSAAAPRLPRFTLRPVLLGGQVVFIAAQFSSKPSVHGLVGVAERGPDPRGRPESAHLFLLQDVAARRRKRRFPNLSSIVGVPINGSDPFSPWW